MIHGTSPPNQVDARKLRRLNESSGPLGERVYETIRDAILSLDFKPGEVIRKGPICEWLGASRSPVADALRRLSTEKLVEVIPQSGTRVSKLSLTAIREEAFLREALEVASVAFAATHRTDKQYARLSRNVRMQELLVEDSDFGEFYKYDEEFHRLIMECCGVSSLAPTVDTLSTQVRRARLLLLPEPGRSADTVNEHKAILKAIQDQNPAAASDAMRQHLGKLIERLEPLESQRPELFDRQASQPTTEKNHEGE